MTAPAVVAWGAFLGWINLDGKWSEWVAHPITVSGPDDLPAGGTGHRSAAQDPEPQDGTAVRHPAHHGRVRGRGDRQRRSSTRSVRLGAGIVGAVLGTMGGAAVQQSASSTANGGQDRPGAFLEDVVAVGGGFLIAFLVSLV